MRTIRVLSEIARLQQLTSLAQNATHESTKELLAYRVNNMLNFQTFFCNIVSVSDLIASDDALKRAWVEGEKSITSAFNYDELAQQVLDDQKIETEMYEFSKELEDVGALAAVTSFAHAFREVDKAVEKSPQLNDPKELLRSEEWASLRKAAMSIIELPSAASFKRQFR